MGTSSNGYELTFSLARVLVELVTKMQEMTMDKTELGCLRAIVLFNPDVKGLKEISRYTLLLSCFLSCSVIVVLILLFNIFLVPVQLYFASPCVPHQGGTTSRAGVRQPRRIHQVSLKI